jgi:hypothetical protein
MKKNIIFCAMLFGLMHVNNSFSMLQTTKKIPFHTSKVAPKIINRNRQFSIDREDALYCVKELEKSNRHILEIVLRNKIRALDGLLDNDTLSLQRIQESYAEQILFCNNKNIENFKKNGTINILVPDVYFSLFYQFEKLIKDKE